MPTTECGGGWSPYWGALDNPRGRCPPPQSRQDKDQVSGLTGQAWGQRLPSLRRDRRLLAGLFLTYPCWVLSVVVGAVFGEWLARVRGK